MSETEHTKLPWLAGTRIRIHGDGWSWVDFGYLAAGSPEHMAEAKANAAFIERAVNAHGPLVEALTEVSEWIKNWSPDFTDDPEWAETKAKIDAALGAK